MNTVEGTPPLLARDPALDWLRGVLVLFVLLLHAEIVSGIERESVVGYVNMSLGPVLMPTFFVISGMLGYRALYRGWPAFLNKTVLRLLWPYAVWGIIYVLAVCLIEQKLDLNWHAFTLLITRPAMLGPIWYLAYLAAFFMLARCLRLVPVWVTLIVSAVATVTVAWLGLPLESVFVHASAFFAGLALGGHCGTNSFFSTGVAGRATLSLTLVALGVGPYFMQDSVRDNGMFIGWIIIASVVTVASAGRLYEFFGSPSVLHLGRESLPFYLTHWPVMLVVSRINSELHLMTNAVAFWVSLFSSLAAGALATWVIRRVSFLLIFFQPPPWARLGHRGGAAGAEASRVGLPWTR